MSAVAESVGFEAMNQLICVELRKWLSATAHATAKEAQGILAKLAEARKGGSPDDKSWVEPTRENISLLQGAADVHVRRNEWVSVTIPAFTKRKTKAGTRTPRHNTPVRPLSRNLFDLGSSPSCAHSCV